MTHNEKVLALLSDGEPHTHHEIYALYVIGHSRIADLRKRGHVIESWREGDDYVYQLCSEESAVPTAVTLRSVADSPQATSSEQLLLVSA